MKKILVIEDERPHFEQIKGGLEHIGYTVVPENFEDMSKAIDPNFIKESIEDFALRQVIEHKESLRLVLCDIRLGDDALGGNRVVKKIRETEDPTIKFIASMIPIVGVTQFVDNRDKIVMDGADFVFQKPNQNQTTAGFSNDLLRTVIDAQVRRFEERLNYRYPFRLRTEIAKFKETHGGKTTAFIMTSFQKKHLNTAKAIIDILDKHGIIGCLANEGEGGKYSDDLWSNIEVYMHGCDFGIGIYADDNILKGKSAEIDLEKARVNPNMSQEVGYMLALQKPVCILKNVKLKNIPADLSGRIYVQYNKTDLETKLRKWLESKGFIRKLG